MRLENNIFYPHLVAADDADNTSAGSNAAINAPNAQVKNRLKLIRISLEESRWYWWHRRCWSKQQESSKPGRKSTTKTTNNSSTSGSIRIQCQIKQVSSMANRSTRLIFFSLALLVTVISIAQCMKRTQYHEQVSFSINEG